MHFRSFFATTAHDTAWPGGFGEESVDLTVAGPKMIAGSIFQAGMISSLGPQSRPHRG